MNCILVKWSNAGTTLSQILSMLLLLPSILFVPPRRIQGIVIIPHVFFDRILLKFVFWVAVAIIQNCIWYGASSCFTDVFLSKVNHTCCPSLGSCVLNCTKIFLDWEFTLNCHKSDASAVSFCGGNVLTTVFILIVAARILHENSNHC